MSTVETVFAHSRSGQDAHDWIVLRKIVQLCAGRIDKHIEAFQGELRNARCAESRFCKPSLFSERFSSIEPRDDTNNLGAYSEATHDDYAQLLHQQVVNLRKACVKPCARIAASRTAHDDCVIRLGELTYSVLPIAISGLYLSDSKRSKY